MGIKDDFNTALKLAIQDELTAARKLLLPHKGNNKKVDQLLATINNKIVEQGIKNNESKVSKRKSGDQTYSDRTPLQKIALITLFSFVGVCSIMFLIIILTPSEDTRSQDVVPFINTQPSIQATDITSEYPNLENRIASIIEVNRINVLSISSNPSNAIDFYTEVMVDYGVDYRQVANDVLDWVAFEMPLAEFSSFSVIIDDRYTATEYLYDLNALGWIVTPLESFNLTRAYLATDTPTPRPRPTQAPQVRGNNGNSSNGNNQNSQFPENCDEAVAMGLSAQQAAQWDHLDRDNDGVACYGD